MKREEKAARHTARGRRKPSPVEEPQTRSPAVKDPEQDGEPPIEEAAKGGPRPGSGPDLR